MKIKEIHNPIIKGIVAILIYIASVILLIPAIPYAIVRGVCNLDYYEEWFDFIDGKIKFKSKNN